jgi:hypothetical protein
MRSKVWSFLKAPRSIAAPADWSSISRGSRAWGRTLSAWNFLWISAGRSGAGHFGPRPAFSAARPSGKDSAHRGTKTDSSRGLQALESPGYFQASLRDGSLAANYQIARPTPYRSHSPITKSSEPRIATTSLIMWPGRIFERIERLQKEGLRIFSRCGVPPPLLLM